MRSTATSLMVLICCAAPVSAQDSDLEPNLTHAARALARRVADHLLERPEVPDALAVVPAWGAAAAAGEAITGALRHEGFTVLDSRPAASQASVLVLEVGSEEDPRGGLLTLAAPGASRWATRCAFGSATWVDEDDPTQVLGRSGIRANREGAVDEAREAAAAALLARAGLAPGSLAAADALQGLSQRVFVGTSGGPAGVPGHRAWVQVDAGEGALQAKRHQVARTARRAARDLLLRGGAAVLLCLGLGLGYLRADLGTRGYMTGRLRLLFGTLLVIGLGFCLRMPL